MRSDISYIAGLLDGEGYFDIRAGKSFIVCMDVANNSPELMDWLVKNFGGRIYERGETRPNEEIGYTWRIASKPEIIHLLPWILPELIVKRTQAQVLLDFCIRFNIGSNNTYTDEDRKVMYKYAGVMKALNSKGPGSTQTKMLIKDLIGRTHA